MKYFMMRALKALGISCVLRTTEVESYLNYYRMDYVDKYDNYSVFEIFYNDTDVFTKDLKYIGSEESNYLIFNDPSEEQRFYSISESLRSCCRVIGTFEDYKALKKPLPTQEDLDKYFEERLFNISEEIRALQFSDFSIRRVDVYAKPTLMIFIHLNNKGKRIKPIKIFIGEKITYSGDVDVSKVIRKVEKILCYQTKS